jgi:hypothetical protein
VDAIENFTGAATDDLFKATAADFQALDSIDGGLGTDTLRVVDTAAFTGFAGTITGIETVSITSGASVGVIQALATAAGTNTAAVAQVSTLTVATATAVTDYTLSVGGVNYAVASGSTFADATAAATALAGELTKIIGDQVTVSATAGVITLTSTIAGTALPSISAVPVGGTGGAATFAAVTANVVATGGVAVKQAQTITFTGDEGIAANATTLVADKLSSGDVVSVYINGVKASAALVPDAAGEFTNAALATQVAGLINTALGAGVAVAGGNTVTLTAPTAGTPLPIITTDVAGSSDYADADAVVIANQALNAVSSGAVSASGVAAPTGTTTYTVVAGGDANVTGVSTAAVDVTGANVRASGGASVKVAASGNVYVSGSTGAVTVTETAVDATGGFYVASNATTGLNADWGSTTTLKAGTLVTGGSSVTINGRGSALSSTTGQASGSPDTSAVQVGSAANIGVSSANTFTGKETILNAGLAPTGDVSVSSTRSFTLVDTANKVNLSSVIYGDGDTKVYMNGGTTASVTGATTVTITDLGTTALKADTASTAVVGTSKLTSATVNGLNGATVLATINSDALTNLTVLDARGTTSVGVTVNNNTVGGHALNLTVGNSGTSAKVLTVTDSTATTVNIASTASSFQALGSNAINTGSASFVTLATAAATAIKMTNAQAVSLGDLTGNGYAKVATLDASGATGAVNATIGNTSLQGLAFTGGAGNDTVTVKDSANLSVNATSGAATTVSLGGGNDTLLNGGTAAVTMVGVRIDAGNGIDTVAASFINAGNAAQFVNFELLGLDRATGTTTDANLLSGVTGLVQLSNASVSNGTLTAGTVTYTGVKASQGLTVVGSAGVLAAGVTALSFEAAVAAGTSDSYTVGFAGAGAASALVTPTVVQAGVVSLAGIETVNVASGSAAGFTNNTISLVAADAKSLVISGSQSATITTGAFGNAVTATSANGLGVALVDASANTAGVSLNLSNTDFKSAVASLTVKGSSGADTITLKAFDAAVVTVDAGAGNDTITTGTQATVLTGGAGIDTFNVALTVNGSGLSAGVLGAVTTIKDFSLGDKLALAATVSGLIDTTADVAAATSLASALDLALKATGVTSGVGAWFAYQGNTYIALEDGTNGLTTGDTIVKFDGTVGFANLLLGTNVLTFA